jgi:hypothetical protein
MENFVKKKIILVDFVKKENTSYHYNHYSYINSNHIKIYGSKIIDYHLINLNKNHISEITESFTLELNIGKINLYNYIQFCTGRKILMIEKKDDFSKKIENFNDFKYQKIIMSNGNQYYVISD